MDGIQFRKVFEARASWLEKEFTEQQIKAALDGIEGDKAPSPDDFNFKFI